MSRGEAPAWDPGADPGRVAGSETPQEGWGSPTEGSPSTSEWPLLSPFSQKRCRGSEAGQVPRVPQSRVEGHCSPALGKDVPLRGLIPQLLLSLAMCGGSLEFSSSSGWVFWSILCVYRAVKHSQSQRGQSCPMRRSL